MDNIIQDFKTVSLGLEQNRYTALTSMNVQTRSWFISAAVASEKFPLCRSCSALSVSVSLARIYLRISITNRYCLQNNIRLSMKIKLF